MLEEVKVLFCDCYHRPSIWVLAVDAAEGYVYKQGTQVASCCRGSRLQDRFKALLPWRVMSLAK